MHKKKVITVVCVGNYCRSPVAEKLLIKKFSSKYKISSAGLMPMYGAGMHEISKNFLLQNEIEDTDHFPKHFNYQLAHQSDLILALDKAILFQLNKLYKKYINKIKLLSSNNPRLDLSDPIKYDENKYMTIMKNIRYAVNNIDL